MIIGTAGHIDHGKTSLVRVLTGIETDRLEEEKRRGITIALGYAYDGPFGFVDVPGHERLVHTMLAGASGIDAALLAVAADDGVMPQTREHAAILDLLGIAEGVIAITKADLASERVPKVEAEVRALLHGSALARAPILPVSAVTGQGIEALRAALAALGERPRRAAGHSRFAVDRVFTLPGAGLIVTGTLAAGAIAVGDRLVLTPSGLDLRVRGLHAHSRAAERAEAGQRAALNIAGPKLAKDAIRRGDWVVHPDLHAPTAQFDARLRLLGSEARPLNADTRVHLHIAAAHVTARVSPLSAARIEPGQEGFVRLALDQAVGALACDRIVLRDATATRTIGGGAIVDPFPPRRGRRTEARLAVLRALDTPDASAALRGLLAPEPHWAERMPFLRARNLPPAEAAAVLDAAEAEPLAEVVIGRAAREAVRAALTGTLAAYHAEAPDQPGLQPGRLRLRLPGRPPGSAFRALLDAALRAGEVEQDGPWLRLPAHRATLSREDEELWAHVRAGLARERFRPPRTRDLARTAGVTEQQMRTTLKRLQRMGFLVEIAHDHFFLRETVAEMMGVMAEVAAADSGRVVRAAAFRDRVENGRKVAIQILEFMDRAGVTVRAGDERRVRPDRLDLFGLPEVAASPAP